MVYVSSMHLYPDRYPLAATKYLLWTILSYRSMITLMNLASVDDYHNKIVPRVPSLVILLVDKSDLFVPYRHGIDPSRPGQKGVVQQDEELSASSMVVVLVVVPCYTPPLRILFVCMMYVRDPLSFCTSSMNRKNFNVSSI